MIPVKKAIIPAAGLGTRFLPATKSVPKEMLPIVDQPTLLYIVEEAVRAGVEDIILIAGRQKTAIEDFFDTSYELEDRLEKTGKTETLQRLRKITQLANIVSVRQKQALGLGHAILCGQAIVGDQDFAVLLGDEIIVSKDDEPAGLSQLVKYSQEVQSSAVAIIPVEPEEVDKYGIIDGEETAPGQFKVRTIVEKPSVGEAPSRWALPGRYVFKSQIFDFIKSTPPGKNGEIQLTDAMSQLATAHGLYACEVGGRRFDAGDKLGFLQANIELALDRPDLGPPLKKYLTELVQKV